MAEALAQTIGYVNRARAFMPPGTVGAVHHALRRRQRAGRLPGLLQRQPQPRRDSGSRANRVRPQFATLPGVTAPPPFGGSQRTIVIRVDPGPPALVRHVARRSDHGGHDGQRDHARRAACNIGDETRISPMNSVVTTSTTCSSCRSAPAPGRRSRSATSARSSDSTDIPTAYALVNGRRAVYIPVTKRPNASTLSVVSEVKANLGRVPGAGARRYQGDATSWISRVNVSASLQRCCRRRRSARC